MEIKYIDGYKFAINSRGHEAIMDQLPPLGGDEAMEPVEFLARSTSKGFGFFASNHFFPSETFG